MTAKKQAKPEPVSLNIVCSICDESWHLHKEINGEVSTLECVRLLKLKRYTPTITIQPRPYVAPWYPILPQIYPTWHSTTVTNIVGVASGPGYEITNYTPTVVSASAAA